jgi:hypothetical protein
MIDICTTILTQKKSSLAFFASLDCDVAAFVDVAISWQYIHSRKNNTRFYGRLFFVCFQGRQPLSVEAVTKDKKRLPWYGLLLASFGSDFGNGCPKARLFGGSVGLCICPL